MSVVEWVHTDALAVATAAPAVFVFDDAAIDGWALQRIGFVYECLLELPVSIRRGNPAEAVLAFAREHGADRVVTRPFVDPRLAGIWQQLTRSIEGEILPEEPFVRLRGPVDLRRFSRYWAKAATALALEASPAATDTRLSGSTGGDRRGRRR
jgi:deoxyribodipyrimidine photo-lyase